METKPKKRRTKKNNHFRLTTDWLLTEPIDYEHKYYMLMDFLKFCDDKIEKFELYPLFSEMSLHLANLQVMSSEFKYIVVNKKFEVIDDEILINELKFTPIPALNDDELEELEEYKHACETGDIVEVLDALCDITYVSLGNGAMLHGLKDKVWPAYQEVQASNLSKACTSEEEAQTTVEVRSKEQGEPCHYEKVGSYYIVYRSSDKKVMKNINYFRPDLSKFLNQ